MDGALNVENLFDVRLEATCENDDIISSCCFAASDGDAVDPSTVQG